MASQQDSDFSEVVSADYGLPHDKASLRSGAELVNVHVSRWDTYGRLVAPHTSRFAWAVIEGNHELEVCY